VARAVAAHDAGRGRGGPCGRWHTRPSAVEGELDRDSGGRGRAGRWSRPGSTGRRLRPGIGGRSRWRRCNPKSLSFCDIVQRASYEEKERTDLRIHWLADESKPVMPCKPCPRTFVSQTMSWTNISHLYSSVTWLDRQMYAPVPHRPGPSIRSSATWPHR
jgi:hypothetical protein